MYDTDSKVILANVKGDRSNSIRTFTVGSPAGTGATGSYTATGTASGNGKSATFNLTLSDTNQITSGTVKLNNPEFTICS